MTNCLVIGSNRGLGLEIVRQLSKRPNHMVYATCRKPSDELLSFKNTQVIDNLCTSSDNCMAQLRQANLPSKLDLVVYSSGINDKNSFASFENTDAMSEEYQVNALGPVRVGKAVEENLQKGSKFAIITAIIGSLGTPLPSMTYLGYRMSKTAANMAGQQMAVTWKKKGVTVGMFHPGFVQTDMTLSSPHYKSLMKPDKAITHLLQNIDGLEHKNTGKFWNLKPCKELPW